MLAGLALRLNTHYAWGMNNATNLVFTHAQQASHRSANERMEALERRMLLGQLFGVRGNVATESDITTAQLWSAVALKFGVKAAQSITSKARRSAFR